MVINDYYNKLDRDQKIKFRSRVFEETGVSYTSFYTKLRTDGWRKSERTIIEAIIKESNYA